MLQSYTIEITRSEAALLAAIQEVAYGELYGVEIDPAPIYQVQDVSPQQRGLIEYIRDGCPYIDVLTIHNGQPVTAETDLRVRGFRARKKMRFPTVHAEG